jgi:hypothetical protein
VLAEDDGPAPLARLETTTHCLTRAEWRQQEQAAKDEINRIQGKLICGQVCLPGE